MTELRDLEAKLGHRFTHPALLEQALTHGSVRHEHQTGDAGQIPPLVADNERLEFLGDAIVGMVVAEQLYRRYPELDEGGLTRLRAALVSRRHLGQVGTALDLGRYLRLGRAEERNGGRKKVVLLANCIEALIGALYLEDGLAAAAEFVERTVVRPYMDQLRGDLRENPAIDDYKTALQELLQSRRAGQPEYTVQAESGPDHRKCFLVQVRAGYGQHGSRALGGGSTKKKAEQEAARQLYEQLKDRQTTEKTESLDQPLPYEESPVAVTAPGEYPEIPQSQKPQTISAASQPDAPATRRSRHKRSANAVVASKALAPLAKPAQRPDRAHTVSLAQGHLTPLKSSRPLQKNPS